MSQNQKIAIMAAAFLLLAGGVGYAAWSKYGDAETAATDVASMEKELDSLRAIIATKDRKDKQKDEVERLFIDLAVILPQASAQDRDRIFRDIETFKEETEMTFVRADYKREDTAAPTGPGAPRGAQPKAPPKPFGDSFEPTDVTVELRGRFEGFHKFLNKMESRPSYVRVDEITLAPAGEDPLTREPILAINMNLKTFNYVVKPAK